MRARVGAVMCLLPGLLAWGCQGLRQPVLSATYKGGQITRDEYRSWLAFAQVEDDPAKRAERLGQIALGRVLSAELRARGGDREPAVAGQLADLEERVLSQALRRQLVQTVQVGDAEVEQALKENDKDRHQPRRVQLANLFKRVPKDASPAVRQATRSRIEGLRRQILAGADFAELARRESDSQTRFRGGRMGVAEPGQLPAHLESVAFQLAEGQVSEVLEHQEGFTLLKCLRILPEHTLPVEEARQKLRQALESKAREKRWEEVGAEVLARWPLVVERTPEAIQSAEPSQVIARFGDRTVTRGDLGRWLGARRDAQGTSDAAIQAVGGGFARQHAAAQRARELGLDKAPEVGSRLAWERLRILATEEMERRVKDAFQEPSEEELRARFESSRDRHLQPARVRVSVLRFRCDDQGLPACYRRAQEVLDRLQAGELSFEQAARELSAHPSSSEGGDLGWHTSRDLAPLGPNLLKTIQELEVGELGPIVREDDALWAVKLAGREAGRQQTLEEARLELRRELGNEQAQAIQKRIQDQLLAELDLKVTTGT